MKKLIAFLLALTMCFGAVPAMAEEDLYAVGGSTLEEAVQMMPGYQIDLNEDGSKVIVVTDLAGEYYVENSENGIAVMPVMFSMMSVQLHYISFCWPLELGKISKMIITTDNNIHTFVPNKPWEMTEADGKGTAVLANEQMETILFEMGKSENVSIEFFMDNATSKAYDLTMEQKYLLRQYVYACETFLPKPAADGTTTFIMSLLSSQFAYTISTVPNPNAPEDKPTAITNPSATSVKEQLQELKEMLDEGLITQDDYDAKKQQLLGL